MISAQVVETSVTNNSSFQNYSHPDDHTIRTTVTPGFKPFTMNFVSLAFSSDILTCSGVVAATKIFIAVTSIVLSLVDLKEVI